MPTLKSIAAKDLESVQIARCPHCNSEDVYRRAGRHDNEGPMDHCANCGYAFPHKPGTVTARQHIDRVAALLDGDGHGMELLSRTAIMLAREDEAGHWVTIGSERDEEGEAHGGAHVFIRDGVIVKGPKSLAGRKISNLKKTKASSTETARTAEFRQRVKAHREKGLDTARAVAKAHGEMAAKAKASAKATPQAPAKPAPKASPKPVETEPELHSQFEHEGVNVAVLKKQDHRGTVYSTKWEHEGEGHNADQWVFSPNRAKDDARYAIDQKLKMNEPEPTPVQHLEKAKAAHEAGDMATFKAQAKEAEAKTLAGKKPPIADRKQLRQEIHQAYKDQGGGLPVEVYRHAESLQNPFTFKRGSAYEGEVKARVGTEGGKEGVGIARSGAINFTHDATKAGGEDAINSFRDKFGNGKGEDYYWQLARERAGYGWQDALEHARNSNDQELKFKAALHDTLLPAKERPQQEGVDPSALKVGEEFTINHIPVEVKEDMEGDKVLSDHGKIPDTPVAALRDKLPVDKGTLREKELPKDEGGDFFADVRGEDEPAKPELKSQAGREAAKVIGKGSTGNVVREGNEAVKSGGDGAEGSAYDKLKGVEGIAQGYEQGGKVRTPFFENVLSTDTTPANRRASFGPIIAKNQSRLLNAANAMGEEGLDYNDPLQVGFDKEHKAHVFDLSNVDKTDTESATTANVHAVARYLDDFGMKDHAQRIRDTVAAYQDAKVAKDFGINSEDPHLSPHVKSMGKNLEGYDPKYAYYAQNARHVSIGGVVQSEPQNKMKVVLTKTPLSEKQIKDWELTPVIHPATRALAESKNSTAVATPTLQSQAAKNLDVDTSRQFGLFAKDAKGNAVEVGEHAGQANLFNPSKYKAAEKPVEAKPEFSNYKAEGTAEMFPASKAGQEAVKSEPEKSKGHIGFYTGPDSTKYEVYKETSGELHRAPISSVIDVTTGNRIGRWEATKANADQRAALLLGKEPPAAAKLASKAGKSIEAGAAPFAEGQAKEGSASKAKGQLNSVRAPAGGKVSEVDGKFYHGGSAMPIHGEYSGQEKSPSSGLKRKAAAAVESQHQQRSAPQPMTPEQVEEHRQRVANEKQSDEIVNSPLGTMLNLETNRNTGLVQRQSGKHLGWGVAYHPWRDYAESVGEQGVKQLADKLRPLANAQDVKETMEHPQGAKALLTKKHQRELSSSVEAHAVLQSAIENAKTQDQLHGISKAVQEVHEASPNVQGRKELDAKARAAGYIPNRYSGTSATGKKVKAGEGYVKQTLSGQWQTHHADDVRKAIGAEAAPAATSLQSNAGKAAESAYAYARPSAVANAGEDLADSARHKRNAWRGLSDAEANGTAEQMVTRDKLLENEPHNIAASVDKNPMTALAMHHAMKSFPPSPAHGRGYEKTAPELKATHRQQFVETYNSIKSKAEELAATEPNAIAAIDRLRNHVSDKIRQLRGQSSNDSIGMATAKDPYNPVANGLVDTSRALSTFRPSKTSVAGKLNDFRVALTRKYGDDIEKIQPSVRQHAKDIIQGKALHQSFGGESPAAGRQKKFNPAEVYVGNPERIGGRDVSHVTSNPNTASQHLINDFKMRGVQWGNSVTDEERAHHAKHVVGALTDLAEATGLKPEDISLNGKLGLAIGARGHGGASAHYEPGNKVINLTRESGVGTLAHEWGHAFDHDLAGGNLSRMGDKVEGDYQSGRTAPKRFVKAGPGDIRGYGGIKMDEKGQPVVEDMTSNPIHSAMAGVREAMQTSGFRKRLSPALRTLQQQGVLFKDPQYWTSSHEMFARTFENHVAHKLREQGRKNTYLAGFNGGEFNPNDSVTAAHLWPTKEESAHMAPAMDKLMAAYRQKKYGSSEPVKFSRTATERIIELSLLSRAGRAA